jgi:hypothetical protein
LCVAEFVKVARELFKFQVEAGDITPSPEICFASPQDVLHSLGPLQMSPVQAGDRGLELERARSECEVLRGQVERLKQMLRHKEQQHRDTEHELHRVRKVRGGARHTQALHYITGLLGYTKCMLLPTISRSCACPVGLMVVFNELQRLYKSVQDVDYDVYNNVYLYGATSMKHALCT